MSLFLAALLLMVARIAHGSPAASDDLDGDGKPDELSISPVDVLEDGSSSLDVVIRMSTRAAPIRADLRSQTPSLQAYISHGALIVDRSQSSRDAAELSYEVFRWDARRRHLCLHAVVTGTPPNQLQGEWLPQDVEVSRYAPCTVLGQKTPAVPVADKTARELALSEAGKLKKTDPVPDYLAFELAAQVDEGTVSSINDIGYYQEQAGFLRQASIILSAVNDRFPRRAVAQLIVRDTDENVPVHSMSHSPDRSHVTSSAKLRSIRGPETVYRESVSRLYGFGPEDPFHSTRTPKARCFGVNV
ncbi:hypothetical protein [Lysobacter soli]|uniref:hypothetical protein n=1 Tax=Lysobacter soli TaxID=453783 RepID=UPI0011C01C0C|nr:hypothetical protein [Lysobacter soli]